MQARPYWLLGKAAFWKGQQQWTTSVTTIATATGPWHSPTKDGRNCSTWPLPPILIPPCILRLPPATLGTSFLDPGNTMSGLAVVHWYKNEIFDLPWSLTTSHFICKDLYSDHHFSFISLMVRQMPSMLQEKEERGMDIHEYANRYNPQKY